MREKGGEKKKEKEKERGRGVGFRGIEERGY